MKRIGIILLLTFTFITLNAQVKAVTETGEQIIIYDDGTWIYERESSTDKKEIPISEVIYETPKKSSFLLKSSKNDLGFWLNPKKWQFKKSSENPDAEYELQLKGEDLYGMIISEKVEIPVESLKAIALENGKSISPDLKIVKEEYRMVNGNKVLLLRMHGTLQGIQFAYYGYYFSNENGTVQFITYTSQALLEEYLPLSEDLLNGLVVLPKKE